MHLKTSERAQAIRASLLAQADLAAAAIVGEGLANANIESLNAAGINVPTHLLAVALIARGNIQTAAEWWSTHFDAAPPVPECFAVLVDLALNLPPQLEGESYNTRTGEAL